MASAYALDNQRLEELNRDLAAQEDRPWTSEIARLHEMDDAEDALALEMHRQAPGLDYWALDRDAQLDMLEDAARHRSYWHAVRNHITRGDETK
jgi:hypothetical protein